MELVQRLIRECGFDAVYFASSIYDFLDLQHRIEHTSASPEMLADAAGGLWSTTSETDPLSSFLYDKAKSGTVYLAGLDLPLGGATSMYQQTMLPIELSLFLPDPRRKQCASKLQRLTKWTYANGGQTTDDRNVPELLRAGHLEGNCRARACEQKRRSGGHGEKLPSIHGSSGRRFIQPRR